MNYPLKIWIGFGSTIGAISTFNNKFNSEEYFKSNNSKQQIHNISKLIGYTTIGAVCGGIIATTAPISIPAYLLYKNYK